MAVETNDDLSVFFSVDDFGQAATYTPVGGDAVTISGIFDDDYAAIDVGGYVAVSSSNPMFHCKTSDIGEGTEGDSLVINSVSFVIRTAMEDGTGTTMLKLERQS